MVYTTAVLAYSWTVISSIDRILEESGPADPARHSFEFMREYFDDIKRLAENIRSYMSGDPYFPDDIAAPICENLRVLGDILLGCSETTPTGDPVRDGAFAHEKAVEIKEVFRKLEGSAMSWLTYMALYKRDEFQKKEISPLESAKKNADILLKDLNEIVSAARDASPVLGVSEFGKYFSEYGDELKEESDAWLVWSVSAGVVTILLIVFFVLIDSWVLGPKPSTLDFARLYINKGIVIGMLVAATAWFARLYKINRNLFSQTKHREISLRTFSAFHQGSKNEDVKNAVLLEATKAVFGVTKTGYIAEKEADNEVSKIVASAIKLASSSNKSG